MTFEKHLRSVSRAAFQRLFISWGSPGEYSIIDRFLGDAFGVLFCMPVLEYCSAVWCSPSNTHFKQLDRVVRGARFLTGLCLSVTLLIVDLWQYCVCCIRSGVIRYTLFMMLYLWRMCQCGLHALLWSHIGILMRRVGAEPRSKAGP